MPDLIWSGVVGAFIALAGAFLANWGHSKRQKQQLNHDLAVHKDQHAHDEERQRIQLSHDSEERRTEREMGLRRDVYLAAAAATGNLQEHLAHSARLDIPESDRIKLLKDNTGVLNKVHLVGGSETLRAFSGIQLSFARGTISVEEGRLAILKKNIDIDALRRELDELQKKRENISEAAKEAIATDAEHRGFLEEYHSISEAIEGQFNLLDQAQDRLFALQLELGQRSFEATLQLQEALMVAVLAARSELGFKLNVHEYEASMAEHRSLLRTEFDAFFKRMKAEVNPEAE